jgi:PilZ domain
MYDHLRQHRRVSLRTDLWIGQEGIYTRTDEFLQDLSVGGAFVDSRQIFPVGSMLSLRFKLPNITNFISCTAAVRNMEAGSGFGIEFLDLSLENRRHVAEYVDACSNASSYD